MSSYNKNINGSPQDLLRAIAEAEKILEASKNKKSNKRKPKEPVKAKKQTGKKKTAENNLIKFLEVLARD